MSQLPQIIVNEPDATYHGQDPAEWLSSHRLAEFRRSPRHYWLRVYGGVTPEPDRAALQVGRAAHVLILEGEDVYRARYMVGGPINPQTGKLYGAGTQKVEAWLAAVREAGREPLLTDQHDLVEYLAAAVRDHKLAMELLGFGAPGAESELTIRAEVSGRRCQARLDRWVPEIGIIDLKTTESLDRFPGDARRFGYIHQLAFYRAVAGEAIPEAYDLPCTLIVVEKIPPYRVGVFEIMESDLQRAEDENETAMLAIAQCEAEGYWPTGFEDRRILTLD